MQTMRAIIMTCLHVAYMNLYRKARVTPHTKS